MLLINVSFLVADINGTVSTFSPVGMLVALGTYVAKYVQGCICVSVCVMKYFIMGFSSRMETNFIKCLFSYRDNTSDS